MLAAVHDSVVVLGLSKRPELNGCSGRVTSLNAGSNSDRIAVQLGQAAKPIALRPSNIERLGLPKPPAYVVHISMKDVTSVTVLRDRLVSIADGKAAVANQGEVLWELAKMLREREQHCDEALSIGLPDLLNNRFMGEEAAMRMCPGGLETADDAFGLQTMRRCACTKVSREACRCFSRSVATVRVAARWRTRYRAHESSKTTARSSGLSPMPCAVLARACLATHPSSRTALRRRVASP
jgi:hypothetical protein